MSTRHAKVEEALVEVFTVFDLDGYTPVSGLTADDFELTVYQNGAVAAGVECALTEVGSSGDYVLSVAAGLPAAGVWVITAYCTFNEARYRSVIEVREHDVDDIFDIMVSGGSGTESVTVRIVDTVHDDTPLADVLVNVFNEDETVFVTFGRTDVDGERTFFLDEGTYALRCFSPGVSFDSEMQLVVETGGGVEVIEAEATVVTPPSNPQLCRFYADLMQQNGQPLADFRIRVTNLHKPTDSTALAVVDNEALYTTDAAGHVEFDVVRGTRIRVSFVKSRLTREIIVPSQSVANLLTVFGAASDAFAVVRRTG